MILFSIVYSNHLSIQNRFFNKYLVRSCVVLFFLLQQFNASDVLAVGVNEEIGQLPYSNKIEEIFDSIDKANDELKKLKRKQLQTISPFPNIAELENKLDSLEKDSAVLLDRQKIYDFKRQNIKDDILSSTETEQNLFVEFVENDSEEYIYDPVSNPLLVESINTTELEYDPESLSNFDIEEQEQMVAKQPSSTITPNLFVRFEGVYKDLANLTENLREMEIGSLELQEQQKEYNRQLIIIQAKEAEIRQLQEKNKALIEYNGLPETISYQSKSLPRERSISVPDDTAVDPYEMLGDNFGLEGLFEENIVPIVDKSPSESYTQPKFNDRKLIDSEDELLYLGCVSQKYSVTQGDSQLSLEEELVAADPNYRKKRSIVVHDNTTVDLDEIFKDSFELETLFEEKVVPIVTEPQSLVAEVVPVKTVKPLTLIIDDPPSQIVKTDTEVETLVETIPKVVVVPEIIIVPKVVVIPEVVAAPKVEALVEVVPAIAASADAYLAGGGVVPPPRRGGGDGGPPVGGGMVPPPPPPRGGGGDGEPPEGDGMVPPPPPPRGGGGDGEPPEGDGMVPPPPPPRGGGGDGEPPEGDGMVPPPPPPRGGGGDGGPPEGDGMVPPPPPPRGGGGDGGPPEGDGVVPPPPPPRGGGGDGGPPEGDGVVPPPPPPRGGGGDGGPPEGDGVVPPPPPPRGGGGDGGPPEGDGMVPPPPPPGGGGGGAPPGGGGGTALHPSDTEEDTDNKSKLIEETNLPQSNLSDQILAEEKPYTPPINFDIENNIVRHITPIEFDYLNLISNALSIRNNILQHNFDNVVEAGDNNYYIGKRGWIQFVRSITKQKGSILGFKNSQQGFILGFDVQPLDKFIVGIAYATASSFTKFQSIFNDQQNTTLHVGAIYSKYALLPNIYLNSYLKYGKAFIQNLGRREGAAIHSKTKGDIARAKLETYYELKLDKFLFKPIAGVIFDHFLIKNFAEYRKEFNINIPTRKGKRILLETGIGLSKAILVKNISIIPEVHLKLDNTLLLKNSIDIISFTSTAHHIQKIAPISQSVGFFPKNIMYTLGGYVNMQSVLALELAAGYDYSFRKNFTTHSFYINGIVKF